MEKNKELLFKKYENFCLVIFIFIILTVLFLTFQTPTKKIGELANYSDGKFKITGFISDIKQNNNTTTFKISDNSGGIKGVIFNNVSIDSGSVATGVCEIKKYVGNNECLFENLEFQSLAINS